MPPKENSKLKFISFDICEVWWRKREWLHFVPCALSGPLPVSKGCIIDYFSSLLNTPLTVILPITKTSFFLSDLVFLQIQENCLATAWKWSISQFINQSSLKEIKYTSKLKSYLVYLLKMSCKSSTLISSLCMLVRNPVKYCIFTPFRNWFDIVYEIEHNKRNTDNFCVWMFRENSIFYLIFQSFDGWTSPFYDVMIKWCNVEVRT